MTNLLEHPEKDRLLETQERKNGFIPVYKVEVGEHTVFTTFAEMPAKSCEAYYLDSDNVQGFLVSNEMDDYARYQVLPESAFVSKPVFIENATPFKDKLAQKAKIEEDRIAKFHEQQEIKHQAFFQKASSLNTLIGSIFDVPETYKEYRGNLSNEQFLGLIPHYPFDEVNELVEKYKAASGKKDLEKYDFGYNKFPYSALIKVKNDLRAKTFEAENGFSITTETVGDSSIAMKALNQKGAVLEKALVHLEPGIQLVEGEVEQVAFVDVFDEDNDCFRFGKRIDPEQSILFPILEDFEEGCFDLAKEPSFDDFITDEDLTVYRIDDLNGLSIYNHMASKHPDSVDKLSLMAKASMKRSNEQAVKVSGVEIS